MRKRAIDIIGELRSAPKKPGVRKVYKPALNVKAANIWELCVMKRRKELSSRLCYKTLHHGWQLVTEPPVTIGADLDEYLHKPLRLNYPCHSQTVEHGVATTSKVATCSVVYEKQLGAAFTVIQSRLRMKGKVCRKRMLDELC